MTEGSATPNDADQGLFWPSTLLFFPGLLLRQIGSDSVLDKYNVIVLDEVRRHDVTEPRPHYTSNSWLPFLPAGP